MPHRLQRAQRQVVPEPSNTSEEEHNTPEDAEQEQVVNARPETINELIRKYIRVLIRPSVATFQQEVRNESWSSVGKQVIILTIFTLVIEIASILPYIFINHPTDVFQLVAFTVLTALTTIPIVFFCVAGLAYLTGKVLGGLGAGKFVTQCYVTALFYVPIGIVMSLIGLFLSTNQTLYTIYQILFLASSVYLTLLLFLGTWSLYTLNMFKVIGLAFMLVAGVVFVSYFISPIPFTLFNQLLHVYKQ